MDETKYCEDCQFFRLHVPFFFSKELSKCSHPHADRVDWTIALITRKHHHTPFCTHERVNGNCGLRAKLFKAKATP